MRFSPGIFGRLQRDEEDRAPSVFLSYAWSDSEKVDKIDQWLRNKGVRVFRDRYSFIAGDTIDENIRSAIALADKIVIFYSTSSKPRDWPTVERSIADEVENRIGTRILVYVLLDETELLSHDTTRVAINAKGKSVREVGEALLYALTRSGMPAPEIEIDENELL